MDICFKVMTAEQQSLYETLLNDKDEIGIKTLQAQVFYDYESSIKLKSFETILKKKYNEYWNDRFETDDNLKNNFQIFKYLDDKNAKINAEKDTDYILITINPRDGVKFQDFNNLVLKSIKKKWISSYLYSFEQRGETEDDVGWRPHCHIILYRKGKIYCEIVREFKSCFKKICNVENIHCLNFKVIKDGTFYQVVNYVVGWKKDEGKHVKQIIDKRWRSIYDIKDYYYFGEELKIVADKIINCELTLENTEQSEGNIT